MNLKGSVEGSLEILSLNLVETIRYDKTLVRTA